MKLQFNILFIVLIIFSLSGFSQTQKDLEKKKKKTQKEINYINNLLKQNNKSTKTSYNNKYITHSFYELVGFVFIIIM